MKFQSKLVRAMISLCLLIYLFSVIDKENFFLLIKGTDIGWASLMVISVFIDRAFMAFKWNMLVRALQIHIPFLECFRVYLIGSFLGMFFPTSVGGDVVRAFTVSVEKGKRAEIAASIVVERIVGLIALILLFFIATLFLLAISFETIKIYFLIALILLVLSLFLFIFSFKFLPIEKFQKYDTGFLGKIRKLVEAYHVFRFKKKELGTFFVLSFFEHFVPIVGNYLTAKALGIEVNPLAFFLMVPVILVFARLPISLDGIGVQEALYLVLFPLAGLTQTDAFSLGLMLRILTIIAMMPGAWLFFWGKRRGASVMRA